LPKLLILKKIEHYQLRIKKLWEKNPLFLSSLLVRRSIRTFYWLGVDKNFNFWEGGQSHVPHGESIGVDEGSVKGKVFFDPTKDLLALFNLVSTVDSFVKENKLPDGENFQLFKKISDAAYFPLLKLGVTKNVVTPSSRSGIADFDFLGGEVINNQAYVASAGSVIYAASIAYAASTFDSVDKTAAFNAVAYDAAAASLKVYVDFDVSFINDIDLAEAKSYEEFVSLPLWSVSMPIQVSKICQDKFFPAINQLIDETPEPEVKQALQKIIQYYQGILAANKTHYAAKNNFISESAGEGDQLNRAHLAEGLADILTAPNNRSHLTIGLLGHWGSGKTRFLELLKDSLKAKNKTAGIRYIDGEFNAWAYEHSDNIQAGLAHEVISSLTTLKGLHWLYRWIRQGWLKVSLAVQFAWHKYPLRLLYLTLIVLGLVVLTVFGVSNGVELWQKDGFSVDNLSELASQLLLPAGGFVLLIFSTWRQFRSVFSQALTKEWLTYIKLPSYAAHIGEVSQMREDIKLMCKIRLKKNERLLFVVDDLDRCDPDGIVKTFEAIRLVLDIPKVIVLVAIDQGIALAALASHYDQWVKHHPTQDAKTIARDYLGKMLHIPITLNEPNIEEVKGYMAYLWRNNPDDESSLDFAAHINKKSKEDDKPTEDTDALKPKVEKLDKDAGLSLEEIAKHVNSFDIKTPALETTAGLSDQQKAAFIYWTDMFAVNNPRQLKRLENSYNLLQKIKPEGAMITVSDVHLGFGLLVGLVTLEFINSQASQKIRCLYKKYLYDDTIDIGKAEFDKNIKQKLDNVIIVIKAAASAQSEKVTEQQAHVNYLQFIELFVLPANEMNDDEDEE